MAVSKTQMNSKGYKRIKILYTGGTIGMKEGPDGALIPIPNVFKERIRSMNELHNEEEAAKLRGQVDASEFLFVQIYNQCKIVYDIKEYNPLLDSSNVAHQSWIQIAKDIKEYYNDYDGFVVLHGTDTLAYTASALSFMLDGLTKPVVLTGAMLPIFQILTDATNNMICSLIIAGCYNIPEVTIFCGDKLLRGNRTTKTDSECFQAFNSLNHPPLACVEGKVIVDWLHIRKPKSSAGLHIQDHVCDDVIIVQIYPGIKPQILSNILQPPIKGAVLRGFGVGNIPTAPELIHVINDAVKKQILIVRVTQCHRGDVSDAYAVGADVTKVGVICGYDMTSEAAFTKLCCILARTDLNFGQKCQMMKTNIRGELSDVTD